MKQLTFLLLAFSAIVSLLGCSLERLPTDEQLKQLLEANKHIFQRAADEFLLKGLYRLELKSDGELAMRPKTVDATSILEMKKLLRDELSINLISSVSKKDSEHLRINEVTFFNYRRGMVFAGEAKGLAYVIDDQDLFVAIDLDNVDKANEDIYGQRLYKFLEPHWYIFYEYSP